MEVRCEILSFDAMIDDSTSVKLSSTSIPFNVTSSCVPSCYCVEAVKALEGLLVRSTKLGMSPKAAWFQDNQEKQGSLLPERNMEHETSPCSIQSAGRDLVRVHSPTSRHHGTDPPLSVVIVRGGQPPSPGRSSAGSSVSNMQRTSTLHVASRAVSLSSSPLESPFKLQPRRSRCMPPTSSSRGRKRGASSITSTIFSDSSCAGDAVDKHLEQDSVSTTLPEEDTITPPVTFYCSGSSSKNDAVARATATLNAMSIKSPKSHETTSQSSFVGSHAHLARSSFSKYAGSPSAASFRSHGSPASPPSGALLGKASPAAKFAPLKVLNPSGSSSRSTPVRKTSGADTAAVPVLKPPPSIVHCKNSPLDTSFLDEESVVDDGNAPGSVDSPSRRSVASMSERTPLPRVSLTPRSSSGRSDIMPSFPSPDSGFILPPTPARLTSAPPSVRNNQEVSLESFGFFVESEQPNEEQRDFHSEQEVSAPLEDLEDNGVASRRQPESFIPLPDFGSSPIMPRIPPAPPRQQTFADSTATRSGSEGGIAMPHLAGFHNDSGSLSASDDEEAFFLVPPSRNLPGENRCQHRANKQRRLQASSSETGELETNRFSFASSMGRASAASLLGVSLVPSSSSLRGLSSNNSLRGMGNREESLLSIGMNVDPPAAASPVDQRNLSTPPIMPQANSPPPLSPRPPSRRESPST